MAQIRRRSQARTVLALLFIVGVFGPATTFGASAATCPAQHIGAAPAWRRGCLAPAIPPLSRSAYAEVDLFTRVNAERQARGLPALHYDARLATFARAWSATMSVSGFRHSDIRRLFEGRFNFVGENIASASGPGASAGAIHNMWMHSDGHRENLLAAAYDVIGIGVYCAPDGTMWATQNFGRHASLGNGPPLTLPPANPIVRGDPGPFKC